MYDEIPSLLYVAGALITVLSWTLFAFSKTIRPEGRRAFILCLSVIWILFFASSTLALVPYPLFEAYSGFMDPDVLDFYDQPGIRLLPAVTCGRLFHGYCRQAFEAIGLRSGCRRKVNPHWCKKGRVRPRRDRQKSIGLSIQNDAKSAVRVETGRRAALLLLETTQTGLPALKSTENR